jgi:hypothetical protein
MKFIRDLMARKSAAKAEKAVEQEAPKPDVSPRRVTSMPNLEAATQAPDAEAAAAPDMDPTDILQKVNASVSSAADTAAAPVNIWDMDSEDGAPAAEPEPAPTPRRRRNQTRVLGFNPMEADVVSIFDKAEAKSATARAKFPVGWILVVSGPGRGECFSLESGMSQIGRGEDQAVQLDFGDNTISRTNHAAIVYDPETHIFTLGHGGKKNIVRLNGDPVISNEALTTNDEIKIGETGLRFVALCNEEFNWGDTPDDEESEDVAIA